MNKDNNFKNQKEADKAQPAILKAAEPKEKGAGSTDQVVLKKDEFEALKKDAEKAKEYWDRILRQQADFDNMRKRLDRERLEFQKFAHEDIIVDLLGILDDLERSVEAAEKKQENSEAFLKGIEMILAHLYELLKKKGVTAIDAKGKKFNPHEHEALLQTPSENEDDGVVLEELQKGYKFQDRVIRTSKVRVAKKVEKEK